MQIYPLGFELGFLCLLSSPLKKEWEKHKTALFSPLCTSYGAQTLVRNHYIKQALKGSGQLIKSVLGPHSPPVTAQTLRQAPNFPGCSLAIKRCLLSL